MDDNAVLRRRLEIASLAYLRPAVTAGFLASLIEAVEARTIVLAVATIRGCRPAGLSALAGVTSLVIIVAVLGPLLDGVPLNFLQLGIVALLLLSGIGEFVATFSKIARGQSKC